MARRPRCEFRMPEPGGLHSSLCRTSTTQVVRGRAFLIANTEDRASPTATQKAELRSFPRVKRRDSQSSEVLSVAGNERKPVLKRGGPDYAVGNPERLTRSLPLPVEHTPSLSYSLCDGKDSRPKPEGDFDLNKFL